MKQLPTVLLTAVIVVLAILVYDQVRGRDDDAGTPPPGPDAATRDAVQAIRTELGRIDGRLAEIETRIRALEARSPSLSDATGTDAGLLERIEELEGRLATPSPDSSPRAAGESPEDASGEIPTGKPSQADIEEFRELAAAARQQEQARRIHGWVDENLKKLGVALDERQRGQLVKAYADFMPRRNRLWGEAKARGAQQGSAVNWDVVIADTNRVIVREFADRISGFLGGVDVMAVSESLNATGK